VQGMDREATKKLPTVNHALVSQGDREENQDRVRMERLQLQRTCAIDISIPRDLIVIKYGTVYRDLSTQSMR